MGRLKNGILDGFSGTLGTVVRGNWRGVQSMSGDSHNTRNKETPAQQEQKAKFALAIRFTRSMGDLFEISYREFTSEMTDANSAHSLIMRKAIQATFPDLSINYWEVLVANGLRSLR